MPSKLTSIQKKFTFRQRIGQINWRLVTSININEIFEDSSNGILELQSILDNITFSELKPIDIRNNSIESIHLLIQLMQLIIEYLLNTQDNQYQIINNLHKRNINLKNSFNNYKKENYILKEDSKIYQKQLSILRHSLVKAQDMIRDVSLYNYQDINKNDSNKLNYKYIQELLQDHKTTYMNDINNLLNTTIVSIMNTIQQTNNIKSDLSYNLINEFKSNIENMIQTVVLSVENTINNNITTKLVQSNDITSNTDSNKSDDEAVDKLKQLQSLQNELLIKENYLNDKELKLLIKEKEFEVIRNDFIEWKNNIEKQLIISVNNNNDNQIADYIDKVSIAIETDSFKVSNANISTSVTDLSDSLNQSKQNHILGFNILKRVVLKNDYRQKSKSFYSWMNYMYNQRENDIINEYQKQLLVNNNVLSRKEQDLIDRLQYEKETAISEQTKYKILLNQIEKDRLIERQKSYDIIEELRSKNIENLLFIEKIKDDRIKDEKMKLSNITESSVMTSLEFNKIPEQIIQQPIIRNDWIFDPDNDGKNADDLLLTLQDRIRRQSHLKARDAIINDLQYEINTRVQQRK